MLQRLLSELVKMESLDQAMVVDDRGRLLASVGSQGKLPPTQTVVSMASAALSASQHAALGDLHEVWFEGTTTVLLDILTPYRILMLQGEQGHLARWRHGIDRLRKQLATTPEM